MLHSAPRAQRRFPADAGEYHRAVTRWILRACLGLSLFGATLIGAPSTPRRRLQGRLGRGRRASPSSEISSSGFELPTAIASCATQHPRAQEPALLRHRASRRREGRDARRNGAPVFADLNLPRATGQLIPRSMPPKWLGRHLPRRSNEATSSSRTRHRLQTECLAKRDDPAHRRRLGVVRAARRPVERRWGRCFRSVPDLGEPPTEGCTVVGSSRLTSGSAMGRWLLDAQDLDDAVGEDRSDDGRRRSPRPGTRSAGAGRPEAVRVGLRAPQSRSVSTARRRRRSTRPRTAISIDSFLADRARGRELRLGRHRRERSRRTQRSSSIPTVAPVHVAYYDGELFPAEYRGSFFFASAMGAADQGAGVWSFGYDVETEVVDRRPAPFVRFRGTGDGAVSGIALGPDGIYFAPLNARDATAGVVYRVTYALPPDTHTKSRKRCQPTCSSSRLGCRSCHALNSVGGTVGPALDQEALVGRR